MSKIARAFPPSEKQSSLSSVSIGKVGTAPRGGQTSLLFPRQPTLCNEERFNIISVEDVKGRGMYTEVLAKKVVATSG